jgi:Na+-translocating ferredoxin:NAD+ oxidoreductase RNF subunit RnfB
LTSKLPWINEDPISSNVKQYLFQANVDACGYDIETWVGHTAHV